MSKDPATTTDDSNENQPSKPKTSKLIAEEEWAIRQCRYYKQEYSDCRSFKARFHQYFIHGHTIDCEHWGIDLANCEKYEDSNKTDIEAAEAIILSEQKRRQIRMKAHYDNNIWKKRSEPPSDWNKPLPDWLVKKNENTLLDQKSKELAGLIPPSPLSNTSFCSIM